MPPKPTGNAMFSKARLDTLSDGIFGVAMTLLILDVRLPDDFHPQDNGELLQGLAGLWPKFLPYLLSFGVLGLRWLSNTELRSRAESVSREYANWWLLYLLLQTGGADRYRCRVVGACNPRARGKARLLSQAAARNQIGLGRVDLSRRQRF